MSAVLAMPAICPHRARFRALCSYATRALCARIAAPSSQYIGIHLDRARDRRLFAAARPIILNGIEEVITRPDLADRAILLMLAPIAERQRRSATALWREFELARPRILGALLDAAAHGLLRLPQVCLQ